LLNATTVALAVVVAPDASKLIALNRRCPLCSRIPRVLNRSADVVYAVALPGVVESLKEALSCYLDELFGFLANLAAGEGSGTIADHTDL